MRYPCHVLRRPANGPRAQNQHPGRLLLQPVLRPTRHEALSGAAGTTHPLHCPPTLPRLMQGITSHVDNFDHTCETVCPATIEIVLNKRLIMIKGTAAQWGEHGATHHRTNLLAKYFLINVATRRWNYTITALRPSTLGRQVDYRAGLAGVGSGFGSGLKYKFAPEVYLPPAQGNRPHGSQHHASTKNATTLRPVPNGS
ncbi:hypothetical protein DFH27DRAFT_54029 [Peziza echinospora]|nr:hypothetical protein DFH27DRAFT_54029 [Peziza echinospora]